MKIRSIARTMKWFTRILAGSRLRDVLRIAAINVVILLLGLVAVELVFGRWFEKQPDLASLPIMRNMDRVFDATGFYPEGGKVIYRRDRFGFRGNYDSPSNIDILAIGGSTTNEMYVSESDTWTDVLAAGFRSAGRPFSVVNAGLDGHSTVGHLHNFEHWFPAIPGLRPRYILAYIGINDTYLPAHADRSAELAKRSPWKTLQIKLRDRSAVYDLVGIVEGMIRAWRGRLRHGRIDWEKATWTKYPLPAEIAEPEASIAALRDGYGRRVALLIDRIRGFGAEAIIVTQQRAGYRRVDGHLLVATSVDLQTYQLQMTFNARAMEVCRAHQAICIDLGGELDFAPGDFTDYMHTTPQGSRRIGTFLYDKLKTVVR